jgi:integrase
MGKAKVIPMRPAAAPVEANTDGSPADKRTVEPLQSAIDALPPGSGMWTVRHVLGLRVYKGARTTTFYVVRKVRGRLAKKKLEAKTLAAARRESVKVLAELKPKPPGSQPIPTLREALEDYLETKKLAVSTREGYHHVVTHYLRDWLDRKLDDLAQDRPAFRRRMSQVERSHGAATAALLIRTYRAIHNWHRRGLPELPESPTVACEMPRVRARDWALDDAALRAWWEAVSQLSPLKRTFWLALLYTGARRDSVRCLRWSDISFSEKIIRFSVAKGGRVYSIPMSDRLAALLQKWREECPSEAWVFPSPQRPDQPLAPQVRDDKRGVVSAHHLRHTARSVLAKLGCSETLARAALGHSLTASVSERYVTASVLTEPLRPYFNAMANYYAQVMGLEGTCAGEK